MIIDNISAIAVPVFRSAGFSFPSSSPIKDLLEIETKIGKFVFKSFNFFMVSVSRSLREGAYALGATRSEVAWKIVVPAALSGIVASFILAISRAIGETMLVTIAAGATPRMSLDPLQSIQTMTAFIVQLSLGETPHGSIEYNTIFAVGLLLFVMTLTMNLIGHFIVRKWQQVDK